VPARTGRPTRRGPGRWPAPTPDTPAGSRSVGRSAWHRARIRRARGRTPPGRSAGTTPSTSPVPAPPAPGRPSRPAPPPAQPRGSPRPPARPPGKLGLQPGQLRLDLRLLGHQRGQLLLAGTLQPGQRVQVHTDVHTDEHHLSPRFAYARRPPRAGI